MVLGLLWTHSCGCSNNSHSGIAQAGFCHNSNSSVALEQHDIQAIAKFAKDP
jgi:hypothetical protein